MYTKERLEEMWDGISFQSSFEPTLNPFKNGLLVNYKKVGTRFFGQLLSLPLDLSQSKIQMDLVIQKNPRQNESISLDTPLYQLDYQYETKFCYTEFDEIYDLNVHKHPKNFTEFSNSSEFLKYCEVENYNELFFNNKKDIIFLIKNPIHRFFSGIIQVLYTILNDVLENEKLINELIFYTKLTKEDILKLSHTLSTEYITDYTLESTNKNEIELLISFIIEKQWNLIYQDIHTANYLFNYVEWIHRIKDKSKIKIIDLKYCLSNKSLDFFTNLMGNDLLKTQYPEASTTQTYWESMANQTGTNKPVYRLFIDKMFQFKPDFLDNSALKHFIKDEYEIYDSLIKSPYYVDLKD